MKKKIPIWEKKNLTIEEASILYGIGEHKLREITEDENCSFVLWIGRKRLIKKEMFNEYLNKTYSI